jgi:3-oxoacyl-[acyl-carrier protein] reductase
MNKRAFVITGASGATGAAAARAFAAQGASLALLGTDQVRLEALGRELALPAARLLTLKADLRRAEAVHAAAQAVGDKFGRVDGLIHLVGGWVGGRVLAETPEADFAAMLEQHAWTTFHLLKEFGPRLAANGWGRVIVVTAPGAVDPQGRAGAYTAAKAAQENLVRNAAVELGPSHVTANIIQVRSIDVKGGGQGTPPGEIVAAMLYLCSDEAGGISGARLPLFR